MAQPEYLNTDKHHRQATQMERQLTGWGKFSTPGYGAVEGGGVTPPITRGTKTGNKVLSLWERRKKKWEKKND